MKRAETKISWLRQDFQRNRGLAEPKARRHLAGVTEYSIAVYRSRRSLGRVFWSLFYSLVFLRFLSFNLNGLFHHPTLTVEGSHLNLYSLVKKIFWLIYRFSKPTSEVQSVFFSMDKIFIMIKGC